MSELSQQDAYKNNYTIQKESVSIPVHTQSRIPTSQISYGYSSMSSMSTISPFNYIDFVNAWHLLNKHCNKLMKLKEDGQISEKDMWEILKQHELLIMRSHELYNKNGKVAVMCEGDLYIGDTLNQAVYEARKIHGSKVYYSETINLIDIPSTLPLNEDRI
jgi:hypothetical protein